MEEGAESILTAAGQEHVIATAKEFEEEKRKALYDQVVALNGQYPGGLKEYVARAKKLLQDSANNANPFEGFTPSVPSGEQVDFAPGEYLDKLESEGMEQIGKCGFVLVAGGLGERLGFSSIKALRRPRLRRPRGWLHPESASSAEADFYEMNRRLLEMS